MQNEQLKENALGGTGISVTCLGFGCASIWGKNIISDREAQNLFEKAYDLGIRYFDTGHSYGNAEKRIGNILKTSNTIKRENIVISTKFGTRLAGRKLVHDVSPEWMRKSVKLSLRRMGTSYIDCLQIHGPRILDFTNELYQELNDLKSKGIVRAVGANSFDTNVLEFICSERKLDFVMLDYNIMNQEREALIRRLYENGIGIIAGAPLAESLYSNRIFKIKNIKDIWYFARALKNFRRQLIQGRKYRFINHIDGLSGTQIALKYVLDNPMVSSAVFGTASMIHLEENVKSCHIQIPKEILKEIRQQNR